MEHGLTIWNTVQRTLMTMVDALGHEGRWTAQIMFNVAITTLVAWLIWNNVHRNIR